LHIAGRRCLSVTALALAGLTVSTALALAQPRASDAAATHGVHIKPKAAEAPRGPLLAVVSIARQRIHVYDETGLVAQAPVSTGMAGYRTPTGVFSVLQKRRYHESNIYSGAPMPFMQRLTWSGVALHAGVLPGFPASHGCIRLPHGFAAELWGMTKLGTRVVVAPDDAPAVAIEDARLPAPRLTPVPLEGDRLQEEAAALAAGPALASAAERSVVDAQDELGPPGVPRLTPWQRANAARAYAARNAATTARAAKLATGAATTRAAEARDALAAQRRAELALHAAGRRRDAAARAALAASRSDAAEHAAQALAAAEDDLAEAQRDADEARLVEAAASQYASEAATAATDAETARGDAAAAVKAVERALEPISILVSKKAGRVYIRQGWVPIHDAPVAFQDAAGPLGTHLYLAMGPAADGGAMRWVAVSLPPSSSASSRSRSRTDGPVPSVPASSSRPETAESVLSRFVLSEETRRFVADRLWMGASLIVSDHGGSETGAYTDFIVLTR
jgi:L,D-transpeptidase-like protein